MSDSNSASPAPKAPDACLFLLQLGGPADQAGIKPFLKNLFADVLPGPKWLRAALGSFIAWRRTPKVAPLYAAIGGGSPLLKNTQAQTDALQAELLRRGVDANLQIVMRYAPPRLDEALARARALGDEVPWIALPLYPHYSYATTRSSMCEMSPVLTDAERKKLTLIDAYPVDENYIAACVANIKDTLKDLGDVDPKEVHLVFSAHGLPLKLVREGDPYPEQVRQTVEAMVAALGVKHPYTLSYQSRVGPVKWLTPSTSATLAGLGLLGGQHVVVVPVSFVSEHIETLQELDIELRDEAKHAGVKNYLRVPTVSVAPLFIAALADQVQAALGRGPNGFLPGQCICDPVRFGKPCKCA